LILIESGCLWSRAVRLTKDRQYLIGRSDDLERGLRIALAPHFEDRRTTLDAGIMPSEDQRAPPFPLGDEIDLDQAIEHVGADAAARYPPCRSAPGDR
jgi:hypothetical protein